MPGPGLPLPVLEARPRPKTTIETPPVSRTRAFLPKWAHVKRRVWGGGISNTLHDSFLSEHNTDGRNTLNGDSPRHTEHTRTMTDVGGTDTASEQVDCVVLDNSFWGPVESEQPTGQPKQTSPDANNILHSAAIPLHPQNSRTPANRSIWDRWSNLSLFQYRVVPLIARLNRQSFDPVTELQYTAETWFNSKRITLMGSLWLVINWILACTFAFRPLSVWEQVFLYGIGPLVTLPLPALVIFDLPKQRPVIYQGILMVSIWSWSVDAVLVMYLCGYYGSHSHWSCGRRDFLYLLYYSSALPAVGMFGLSMARIPTLVGSITFTVLSSALLVPYRHQFLRNTLNTLIFHLFLLYMHYTKEKKDRHLFTIRNQLMVQFRHATTSSKNEKFASDSKRRLTSYIFHEVRVPLNTAMLALQNLEASFPKGNEQGVELTALQASLGMMSKVLSDILDFNRMDAGRFESVYRPYSFHVIADLDPNVDVMARTAAFRVQGKTEEWIARQLSCEPDKEAFVMGDEMRLIQVLTNLTSNACKFTPSGIGGKITVRTRLVYPQPSQPSKSPPPRFPLECEVRDAWGATAMPSAVPERRSSAQDPQPLRPVSLSDNHLNRQPGSKPPPNIVVRIEVHDTGVGISARDMIDNRLFSPYVQTEIGRHQGGKGTGLGLALVSNIVKLSRGRLGVRSKRNEGSCFWVELPLGIVPADLEMTGPSSILETASPPPQSSLVPVVNPFFQKYIPDRNMDAYTSTAEITPSSQASNFLHLVGPLIPPENRDSVHLGLQEASTLSSFPFMHPRNPSIFSTSNVSKFAIRSPRASSLPHVYSSPQSSTHIMSSLVALRAPKERVQHPPYPGHFFSPIFHSAPSRPPFKRVPSSPPIMTHVANDPVPLQKRPEGLINVSKDTRVDDDSPLPIHALVVDDDQLTRRLMVRMLQRIGCNVETAENGQRALEIILGGGSGPSDNFEIVFLDNQMPVLSGVQMVKRLRELGRTEFIVGITGNALKEDQTEYMEAGLDKVLTKPVLERSLKEMLKLVLDRRRTPE